MTYISWEMSLRWLASVKDDPKILPFKFGQNQANNRHIPEMDKCCLDNGHCDSWNLL